MRSCILSTVAILGLLAGFPAWADSSDAQPEFAGEIGAMKCAQFTAMVASDGGNAVVIQTLVMTWAQGYMAAWNNVRMVDLNKNPLDLYSEEYPKEAQQNYLAQYCLDHPSDQIIDATINLLEQMQKGQ
jgi:hypothetical protein